MKIFLLTSGWASPCTMHTSKASWSSPENTTGVSTVISGGSIEQNKIYHDYLSMYKIAS